MSSEKENTEMHESNQDEQPEVPISDAEVKADATTKTDETPKEPEAELSEEEMKDADGLIAGVIW